MPVDNRIYDRPGDLWWDDAHFLSTLRTMVNPGRVPYFQTVLRERLRLDPRGKRTLDVGCGGGVLAEEFARWGCAVTGVDPSAPSLETARAHAMRMGLSIDYRVGSGERLPFDTGTFDIVYCCDVLEHVDDPDRVIGEVARVLKDGGVFCYDTINRTLLSRVALVALAQEWGPTRFVPRGLHDWRRFITPRELARGLTRHGLRPRETVGLTISGHPLALARGVLAMRAGRLTPGEWGRRFPMQASRDLSGSYMGYAVKDGCPAGSRPMRSRRYANAAAVLVRV